MCIRKSYLLFLLFGFLTTDSYSQTVAQRLSALLQCYQTIMTKTAKQRAIIMEYSDYFTVAGKIFLPIYQATKQSESPSFHDVIFTKQSNELLGNQLSYTLKFLPQVATLAFLPNGLIPPEIIVDGVTVFRRNAITTRLVAFVMPRFISTFLTNPISIAVKPISYYYHKLFQESIAKEIETAHKTFNGSVIQSLLEVTPTQLRFQNESANLKKSSKVSTVRYEILENPTKMYEYLNHIHAAAALHGLKKIQRAYMQLDETIVNLNKKNRPLYSLFPELCDTTEKYPVITHALLNGIAASTCIYTAKRGLLNGLFGKVAFFSVGLCCLTIGKTTHDPDVKNNLDILNKIIKDTEKHFKIHTKKETV